MICEFLNALQDLATQKMFLSIATVLLYLFFTSAVLCFKLPVILSRKYIFKL